MNRSALEMRLVVGLGNPGSRYEGSRHNVGFMVVDEVARRVLPEAGPGGGRPAAFRHVPKLRSQVLELHIGGEKVILAKPQTYMNLSGEAVALLLQYYGLAAPDMIVVYDDMDVPFGRLRIRPKGGPGTHNGMRSIVSAIGSEDFPRIRLGIGVPNPAQTAAEFVLSWFDKDEMPVLARVVKGAAAAVEAIITGGIDNAMNRFNVMDFTAQGEG